MRSISSSNAVAVIIQKSRLPRDLDKSLVRALGNRAAKGTEAGRAAEPWDRVSTIQSEVKRLKSNTTLHGDEIN